MFGREEFANYVVRYDGQRSIITVKMSAEVALRVWRWPVAMN